MIWIIIEFWPGGDERRKRMMARGMIANDGSGTRSRGNYFGNLGKVAHLKEQRGGGWWKTGKVLNFPRTRLGVWDLLYRLLRELVGDRNP